jgi:diguanylate cyclase (GGDEF)-like protein
MAWQSTAYAIPGLLAAAAALAFLVLARKRRRAPGAGSFFVFVVAVAFWSALDALVVSTTDLSTKLALTRLQYVGIALAPVAWFSFAVHYCGQGHRVRGPRSALLALFPVAVVALVLTNDRHRWFHAGARLDERAGLFALVFDYGPAFLVYSVGAYALIFAATAIFLWNLGDSPAFRAHRAAVVAAPGIVIVTNALYLSKAVPALPIDLTPLGFVGAIAAMSLVLFRHGFFDAVPPARDAILQAMPEAVLLVDGRGAVTEGNRAAQALFPGSEGAFVGRSLATLDAELASAVAEVPDGGGDFEIDRAGERTFDVLVSPVASHGGTVRGRLVVLRDVTDRKAGERALLTARARLEAANEELARLAATDQLTGLANRRHFMEELERALRQASRRGERLSLLLLDLDDFKGINDRFGHPAGDELLARVGEVLDLERRAGDLSGRLGGEEFAVLLPATDAAGALQVGDRIRVAIGTVELRVDGGGGVGVTMSGGLATAEPGGGSVEELVRAADRALYAAKREGKDRVVAAPALVPRA